MATYARVISKCASEVLHSLMAPKRNLLSTLVIFIIFIDFLTCHQTPNEISTPTPRPQDFDRSDAQDSLNYDEITTIVSSKLAEDCSQATTTPELQTVPVSNPIRFRSESSRENRTATDKPPDLRQSQPEGNELENRLGKLAPSVSNVSTGIPSLTARKSTPGGDFGGTTVSSLINDDETVVDLRTLLMESSPPLNESTIEATTFPSVSSISNRTISAENQRNLTSRVAPVQDLESLETSGPKNSLVFRDSDDSTRPPESSSSFFKKSNPIKVDLYPSQSSDRRETIQPQTSPTNSLIPNASLLDLFHIIKHLNLMSESDEMIPKNESRNFEEVGHSNTYSAPDQTGPGLAYEQNEWSQGAWNRRQIPSDYLMPNHIRSMRYMAKSDNSTPEVLTTLDSTALSKLGTEQSHITGSTEGFGRSHNVSITPATSDDTKRDSKFKSPHNAKRPFKKSLISPYSANFESGLDLIKNAPVNRASKPSLMEQFDVHSFATGRPSLQGSRDRQKLKIGSRLIPEKDSNSKSKSDQISEQATDKDVTMSRYTTKKPSKAQKSPQESWSKSESASKIINSEPSIDLGTNSERGERDITNSIHKTRNNSTSEIANQEFANTKIEHGNKVPPHSGVDAVTNRKYKRKEGPYQVHTSPENFSEHSRPMLYPVKVDTNDMSSEPGPSSAKSYLDDPHKRSYYWTSGQAGLYLDESGAEQPHPGPLTIGELARQHGITSLGLQSSPYFDSASPDFHHTAPMSENFGLISESNLDENFTKVPQNHQKDLHTGVQSTGNHTRIDDELKKVIAIRAIEAVAKNPQLSASLLGSTFNFNREISSTHQQEPDFISNPLAPIQTAPFSGVRNHKFKSLDGEVIPNINSFKAAFPFPDASSSSTFELDHALNGIMMPMATTQDNQLLASSNLASNTTSAQPVNLIITDLANKWALSRMPDLVPIPLAATVPGYLIRLPNGKILAAALTNLFSIQGIQQGPLTTSYKNLINNKFKGLIKPSHQTGKSSYSYGNVMANSGIRPTVVLPPGHYPYGIIPAPTKTNQKSNRHLHREKPTSVGLLSRVVLNQLGLRGSKTYHRDHSRLSKQPLKGKSNSKSHDSRKQNKLHVDKLQSSPFPPPALSDQELANLPIANPNEPVFSFADESQLIEQPQSVTSSLSPHNPASPSAAAFEYNHQVANQFVSNIDPPPLASESGSGLVNLRDKLSYILNNSRNLSHLGTYGGLSGDQFLNYNSKKRKSLTKPTFFTKLESFFQWLASQSAKLRRKDFRHCTDKV